MYLCYTPDLGIPKNARHQTIRGSVIFPQLYAIGLDGVSKNQRPSYCTYKHHPMFGSVLGHLMFLEAHNLLVSDS